MENLIFYIYTILASDERYKDGDKGPVYGTIFLISFFELVLLLPFLLLFNKIFSIVNTKTYLSQSMGLRYLLILGIISLVFFINFCVLGYNRKIETIAEKLEFKRERYLKYKWLLMLFALVLGGIMILFISLIR